MKHSADGGRDIYFGCDPSIKSSDVNPIKKSRAVIVDSDGKTVYQSMNKGRENSFIVYPGGKLEENESHMDGLLRELEQELDLKLTVEESEGLLKICNIRNQDDAYIHHGQDESEPHRADTQYSLLRIDDINNISPIPPYPTKSEFDDELTNHVEYLEEMPEVIDKYETKNPAWDPFMKREMGAATLAALGIYKSKIF